MLGVSSAEQVSANHPLKARGYIVAGTAALVQLELAESYRLHNIALDIAIARRDIHDALWGRFSALIYLEDESSIQAANELRTLRRASHDDRLRAETAQLLVARLQSGFRASRGSSATRLLRQVSDPTARTSAANVCSYVLALRGRYSEAVGIIDSALEDAESYRLSFATPHLQWTKAFVELGLRRLSRADRHLRIVEAAAQAADHMHLELNGQALRARILLTQHRVREAVEVTSMDVDRMPTPAMFGEYMATRALSLAVAAEHDHARRIASEAREITSVAEVQALASVAEAISTLGEPGGEAAASSAFDLALELDTWDALVCGVRAAPKLLDALLAHGKSRRHLVKVLTRSRDVSLLKAAGLVRKTTFGQSGLLSPREKEVIELIGQGLTNREIAQTLYISAGTTKSHVEHILRKLRARSRADAVVRYAAEEASSGKSRETDWNSY
jgi:ATP/maltotriose-dependent transcriptional regulator MalT